MSSSPVIQVENLSKYYRLGLIGGGTLSEDINRWIAKARGKPDPLLMVGEEGHRNRKNGQIWALKDINLEVKEGEILGIIGRNGAGKSTLLKILSKITAPTEGRVKIRGRVGSLLEVGTGFHPELTGRENIYLNGTILGMNRREVTSKLGEIIKFAEMGKFIDTPVKRYSSGMRVRLAFAVAAHLEPEILIVDEVLAVGDAAFQKKCLGKMKEVAVDGRTILFVSHNMGSISKLCTRVAEIQQGIITTIGSPDEVIKSYISRSIDKQSELKFKTLDGEKSCIKSASILDSEGIKINHISYDRSCKVSVEFELESKPNRYAIAIRVIDLYGNNIFTSWDTDSDEIDKNLNGISECTIPARFLKPGQYVIKCLLQETTHSTPRTISDGDITLTISETGYTFNPTRVGLISPNLEWTHKSSR